MDKKYHKALVIFLDILGSQNQSDFERLYQINSIFHNQLEKNQGQDKSHTVYERHIYSFSDCSYIIYDFKDGIDEARKDIQKLMNVALYNTQVLLQIFLLKNRFICRGGVAYDDVYYEKSRSLFFGPAVNKAYQLESKVAKYPRIVVDDFVAKQVISYNRQLLERQTSEKLREYIKSQNGDIILLDSDGKYHLNYLCSVKQGYDYRQNLELLKILREFIKNEIKNHKNNINKETQKIIEKYEWLSKYVADSEPKQDNGQVLLYTK